MSARRVDLAHGWQVHIQQCADGEGRAVILNVFEHPTTGYAFFSEKTTAAAAMTSDQTDTLTTAAHAYAVSIGALDA